MARVLVVQAGKASVVDAAGYASEEELQRFLKELPVLLPLNEVDPDAEPVLPIGWEVSVESGTLDIVFIDSTGLLTIVETKLRRNPEVRREVVGQVLEYAVQICEWSADQVESMATQFLASKRCPPEYQGLDLVEAVKKASRSTPGFDADDLSYSDFKARIESHLSSGRVRLVVAVDELVEPLRKLVTFLNSHSTFDIFVLQVSRFDETPERRIFIPTLYGYAPTRRPGREKHVWDEESFFAEASALLDQDTLSALRKLYELGNTTADVMAWGTGHQGTFAIRVQLAEAVQTVLVAFCNGRVDLYFGGFKDKLPDDVLRTFRDAVNEVPGIRPLPADTVERRKYPVISLADIASEQGIKKFLAAVSDFIAQARASHGAS